MKRITDSGKEFECICQDFELKERSGHTATCSREFRKFEEQSLKPVKQPKKIAKVGTKNTFECSDGTRVTQKEINFNRTKAYIEMDKINAPSGTVEILFGFINKCEGCGAQAQGHAHIISQARCKVIGKTELIWERENLFHGCFVCNAAIENPKSHAWKSLKNIQKCLDFIKIHDG